MAGNGSWRRDERPSALAPVRCARCGAEVLAVKFSPQHTSVQWNAQALGTCLEFAAELASGGRASALVEACASLRASIQAAAEAGRLEVTPP